MAPHGVSELCRSLGRGRPLEEVRRGRERRVATSKLLGTQDRAAGELP